MTIEILDLFCGAGGAAVGMKRAVPDAHITGIDIIPQPRYPFDFVQGDALCPPVDLSKFDFIWASPKCQGYSITINIWKNKNKHERQIEPLREILIASGRPYIIENVPGAPLKNPVILCGHQFGLRVYRHRLFESNVLLTAPPHNKHIARASYGRKPTPEQFHTISGHFSDVEGARRAMGIDWMTRDELAQAIPPAYSEYLLRQVFPQMTRMKRAEGAK